MMFVINLREQESEILAFFIFICKSKVIKHIYVLCWLIKEVVVAGL